MRLTGHSSRSLSLSLFGEEGQTSGGDEKASRGPDARASVALRERTMNLAERGQPPRERPWPARAYVEKEQASKSFRERIASREQMGPYTHTYTHIARLVFLYIRVRACTPSKIARKYGVQAGEECKTNWQARALYLVCTRERGTPSDAISQLGFLSRARSTTTTPRGWNQEREEQRQICLAFLRKCLPACLPARDEQERLWDKSVSGERGRLLRY